MVRKIIKIDEEKCTGCGACASACHEGAIGMLNGKAKLLREDYCDGLGDCLPACPAGAISFETRDAPAYDLSAVEASKNRKSPPHACPGSAARQISPAEPPAANTPSPSRLTSWPVQIKLVPVNAPFFNGADLLVAADCTAYAYGGFHNDFMKGKIPLIGCPKLDMTDYSEKLTRIIAENDIQSVTVVRMEVPCCGGLEHAVTRALTSASMPLPLTVITVTTDGKIKP